MNEKNKKHLSNTLFLVGIIIIVVFLGELVDFVHVKDMGFYNSGIFRSKMGHLKSESLEMIRNSIMEKDEKTGEYILSKDLTESEKESIQLRVDERISVLESELDLLKEQKDFRSDASRLENEKRIKEVEAKMKTVREDVAQEIIREKLSIIKNIESTLESFNEIEIRIRRGDIEVYRSHNFDDELVSEDFLDEHFVFYVKADEEGSTVGSRVEDVGSSIFNVDSHFVEEYRDFEIVIYSKKSPEYYSSGYLNDAYHMYLRENNMRMTKLAMTLIVGVFLIRTATKIRRKNITENRFLKRTLDLVSTLKFEPKILLVVFSTVIILDFDHEFFWSIPIAAAIIIISATEFVMRDKEEYFKNSYIYQIRERKRKGALKGLAKGLDFIFDSIFVIGAVIIGILAMAVFSASEELYIVASAIGGTMILFLVRLLRVKLNNERMGYIDEISKSVEKMINEDTSARVPEDEGSVFVSLAKNINKLQDGYSVATEEKIKSERMKTELITNVSHDLKTPLTSIINYIDILKKEEIEPEHARDYVSILEQKSQRLNTLVQDLFEVSKAASGNIELENEKIDVVELLKQTLGEQDSRIKESELSFVTNIPNEPINIKADGKKLQRVFDNLIVNATKYSLKGTRVYIDLIKKDKLELSIKNIANYEMNFSEDEIVERFTRGDSSRNSEGSGLGLAIAKSLTDLMGIGLKITVDGDLFKVTLTMDEFRG